jgi:hypothetical protein
MFEPFSNAIVLALVVAFSASFGDSPRGLYNIDFRETPAKIGTSKFLKSNRFFNIIEQNIIEQIFQNTKIIFKKIQLNQSKINRSKSKRQKTNKIN